MLKSYLFKSHKEAYVKIYDIISHNVNKCNDLQIIQIIINNFELVPQQKDNYRNNDRFKCIVNLINKLPVEKKINSYLDFGCGDGSITQYIGAKLKLPTTNIYGLDIQTRNCKNITYLHDIQLLNSASVDLITAFVSFHHIKNINLALEGISRVIKPGGVFIIREHNFDGTKIMKEYLDLIHMFIYLRDYSHHKTSEIETLIKEIHYCSSAFWTKLILSYGFKLKNVISYSGNNPQKLYYASYVKL
jgi:SAM-dependent methyltransferase